MSIPPDRTIGGDSDDQVPAMQAASGELGGPLMRRAAHRSTEHPSYLGWVLQRHLNAEQGAWGALAATLGLDEAALDRIALCRRPRPQEFAADVRAVATIVDADPAALARIIRLVDAMETMAPGGGPDSATAAGEPSRPNPGQGVLVAARMRPAARSPESKSGQGRARRVAGPDPAPLPTAREASARVPETPSDNGPGGPAHAAPRQPASKTRKTEGHRVGSEGDQRRGRSQHRTLDKIAHEERSAPDSAPPRGEPSTSPSGRGRRPRGKGSS
jgi:hypothetical protein